MGIVVAVYTPFTVTGNVVETAFGPCGPVQVMALGDSTVVWMTRRGDPRARVIAAKEQGAVHAIGLGDAIALSSPQSLVPIPQSLFNLGNWIVPSDALDQTRGTPTTFFTVSGLGYLPQSPPFCPETRAAIVRTVAGRYDGVVVAAPARAITLAETRAWAVLGGQIAMPGLGPEWYLCRELEIGYAPLCHVSWLGGQEERLTEDVARPVIERAAASLPETHSWEGANAAARREFGEGWHNWIKAQGAGVHG